MPQLNVGQSLSHPPPRYLRGKEQSALFSDSDNDKITMGDVGDLDMTIDSPYSCSFWINLNVDASSGTSETAYHLMGAELFNTRGFSIAYVDGLGNNQYFSVRHNGSGTSTSVTTASGSDIEHDRWYHVVYTYSYPNARIYINGEQEVLKNDMPIFATILDTDEFRIGGTGDLNGYFCQASIWEKQLSTAEIQRLYSNGFPPDINNTDLPLDYLMGYWKLNFEDGPGTATVLDKGTRANNLNTTNLIAADFNQSSYPEGDVKNKGFLYNPVGTYAEGIGSLLWQDNGLPGVIYVNRDPTNGGFAISAWLSLDNIQDGGLGYQILLEDSNADNSVIYRYGFKDGKPMMKFKTSATGRTGDWEIVASSALSVDTLYHITYVHRYTAGAEMEIYVNGTSVASESSATFYQTFTNFRETNYRIGASNTDINGAGDRWGSLDGYIYQLGFFRKVKDDADVAEIYNSGTIKSWVGVQDCESFLGMGDGPEGKEYIYNYGGDSYISDTQNSQKIYDLTGNGNHAYLTKNKTSEAYSATNMVLGR